MIAHFADRGTEDIFHGENTRWARARLPRHLWSHACELLDIMNAAEHYSELAIPAGSGLHWLSRDRKGQMAIKINAQYRICFTFANGEFNDVEIVDYH